jgi:hypothetical protein
MSLEQRASNQKIILAAIAKFQKKHGYGPSYRDLARPDGLTDLPLGSAYQTVQDLRAEGFVTLTEGVARSIKVVG